MEKRVHLRLLKPKIPPLTLELPELQITEG